MTFTGKHKGLTPISEIIREYLNNKILHSRGENRKKYLELYKITFKKEWQKPT